MLLPIIMIVLCLVGGGVAYFFIKQAEKNKFKDKNLPAAVNLSKQAARIQAELDAINPINAGKKKTEVAALLDKFFPHMEKLETQLRKYKKEIALLAKENTSLEKKLDAAKPSVTARLEAGKLQQEIQFLRQFYDSTPDEYKAAYRAAQQKRPPTQQR